MISYLLELISLSLRVQRASTTNPHGLPEHLFSYLHLGADSLGQGSLLNGLLLRQLFYLALVHSLQLLQLLVMTNQHLRTIIIMIQRFEE